MVLWSEWKRLRREIRLFRPDIVHAHFGTMTAFVAATASPKPLVITFHGSDLNPTPGDWWLKSKLGRVLSHLSAIRASQIICVSPQLSERVAYLGDRVRMIPCGVNLDRFKPMSRTDCRTALGWPLDERVVLFNARTDPIGKRLDLAEATAAIASKEVKNLRLHVFRGTTHPDEMPLYYAAADCLLMTSDYEGSPMVVKEALASNLPVVSVDVGDVAKRIKGVACCSIVERDPLALGAAVVDAIRSRQASNGRERIQNVSEEAVADQLLSIYHIAASLVRCPDSRLAAQRRSRIDRRRWAGSTRSEA
jgi:glycosyltransferase involved in cell wall biosynthesis